MLSKKSINFAIGLLLAYVLLMSGMASALAFGGGAALGNYTNSSVNTAGSKIIQPSAPVNVVRTTGATFSNFKGTLTVNRTTRAVRVTNASPTSVSVRGYGSSGVASEERLLIM